MELQKCFADNEYIICINAKLFNYWTPLLYASQSGSVDCVRFLVDRKAEVDICCNDVTCLMTACDSSSDSQRVFEVVEYLLENGAPIQHKDYRYRTALMFACGRGHLEVVRLIIDESELEAADINKWTALFHAVDNNQIEVVKFLLEKGARTNEVDARGYTIRKVAETKGFQDLLDLIPTKKPEFTVPSNYLNYSKFHDLLPVLNRGDGYEMLFFIICKLT